MTHNMELQFEELVSLEKMTAIAQWINTTFHALDYKILDFYHWLHAATYVESLGYSPLDVFVQFFTKLGDGGIFLILLSLFLMLFKKSRKVGVGMLGGIIIGTVFTNLVIKNLVARPRPYNYLQTYRDWFQSVWHAKFESEFSFPSGHTTVAMDSMTPVFLFCNKKKSWLVFLFVIALGASRNYIMVHYPSDILGGIIIGGIAGLISYFIVNAVYDKICEKGKLGNVIKTFDLKEALTKKAK